MRPFVELGGEYVPSYSLLVTLAWLLGGALFYRAARRDGMSAEQALAVMAGCGLGAVFGAIVVSALFVPWSELPARLAEGSAFIGRTVIGGIGGGIVGVELAKKKIGYTRSTGDAFALAIPLGHALGRIGCFLQGCCFGSPSGLPWAVRYPAGSFVHASHLSRGLLGEHALASLPVHPAPIYELIFDLTLFALLWRARRRLRVHGSLFRLYVLSYALFRFIAEFTRGDSFAPAGSWLKPIQYVLLAAALGYAYRLWRHEGRLVGVPDAGASSTAAASEQQ